MVVERTETKFGPVLRYDEPHEHEPGAIAATPFADEIEAHVEACVGPVPTVIHEILSERVHMDILVVEPSETRPFRYFVTSGMSSLPMAIDSPDLENKRFSELSIALPPTWPAEPGDDELWYPLGWLKYLASFPHHYDTWLWLGHSMPNGDPAEAIGFNTAMSGFIIAPSLLVSEAFDALQSSGGARIGFHAVYPVYDSEMQFKLTHGVGPLFDRFVANGVTELFDPARPPVV